MIFVVFPKGNEGLKQFLGHTFYFAEGRNFAALIILLDSIFEVMGSRIHLTVEKTSGVAGHAKLCCQKS